jgi:hypothetical protein
MTQQLIASRVSIIASGSGLERRLAARVCGGEEINGAVWLAIKLNGVA